VFISWGCMLTRGSTLLCPCASHSQNRICINVGRSPRHFLFENVVLARMNTILNGTELSNTSYYGSDLSHEFMTSFPHYPVVRLTIQPGEAYIAPTENIIHDGFTLGMTHQDLTIRLIGSFAPRHLRRSQKKC
jgi:hypothetical protein